jgi:hypothetical protein
MMADEGRKRNSRFLLSSGSGWGLNPASPFLRPGQMAVISLVNGVEDLGINASAELRTHGPECAGDGGCRPIAGRAGSRLVTPLCCRIAWQSTGLGSISDQ